MDVVAGRICWFFLFVGFVSFITINLYRSRVRWLFADFLKYCNM